MKIEQNIVQFASSGAQTGYVDLARALSAVNGKSITQTKRSKGKYKPLGFLVRVRALSGNIFIGTLNCGYPTRNAVVLAGHARDEMLKSAGVSRSNLESYQKELRIKLEAGMASSNAETFFPGGNKKGTAGGGWGNSLTYDYTSLVIEDPDEAGTTITKALTMLGEQADDSDDWDDDTGFYVVDNWYKWRHSFTPAASADDIQSNVFSWAIQQSDTADAIVDRIDDEADEKPYDLTEFTSELMETVIGTDVGNPTTATICVPLGLLKIASTATAIWEIEVVGVTEL